MNEQTGAAASRDMREIPALQNASLQRSGTAPSSARCMTCVLPRSNRAIGFVGDECVLCAAGPGRPSTVSSSDELEGHLDRIREAGKGKRYDCVVGVSGGRDSSYLLHQLVREHGLRCLAAYHRTPFTPDIIDANVLRLTNRLGVPLVRMDIATDHHRRWARAAVMLWLREPSPVTANLACAPCKQHNREILKIARRHRISYLVMGSNRFEAAQISAGHHAELASKGTTLTVRCKQLLKLVQKGALALTQSVALWRFLPVGVRAVLFLSPDAPTLRLLYPEVRTFNYFYNAGWDETECEAALRELGWQTPPGVHSSWRADCEFAEIKNYMFERMMGMTYTDAFFSNRIREGDLNRSEALRRLEVEGQPSLERLAAACQALDIPVELFSQA